MIATPRLAISLSSHSRDLTVGSRCRNRSSNICAVQPLLAQPSMPQNRLVALLVIGLLSVSRFTTAQPLLEPPPLWDVAVGGSFVGTSGNADTSTFGADLALHRRWIAWQVEGAAATISTSDAGDQIAERYLAAARANRQLSTIIGVSIAERFERDRFAGIDYRSILDGGLTYALVRQSRWTLDALTSIAWSHENPAIGDSIDHPAGVLQALN